MWGIEMSREDADIFEQLYRSFQKKITLGNRVEGFLDYCKSNDIFIAISQMADQNHSMPR